MRNELPVSVMGLIAAVSGCTRQEAQPVSWYLENPRQMQSKVVWCADDAERLHTADCQNATEAKRRTQVGSQSSLAPIDWAAKPKP